MNGDHRNTHVSHRHFRDNVSHLQEIFMIQWEYRVR